MILSRRNRGPRLHQPSIFDAAVYHVGWRRPFWKKGAIILSISRMRARGTPNEATIEIGALRRPNTPDTLDVDAKKYPENADSNDGRRTEAQLQNWFRTVTQGMVRYAAESGSAHSTKAAVETTFTLMLDVYVLGRRD